MWQGESVPRRVVATRKACQKPWVGLLTRSCILNQKAKSDELLTETGTAIVRWTLLLKEIRMAVVVVPVEVTLELSLRTLAVWSILDGVHDTLALVLEWIWTLGVDHILDELVRQRDVRIEEVENETTVTVVARLEETSMVVAIPAVEVGRILRIYTMHATHVLEIVFAGVVGLVKVTSVRTLITTIEALCIIGHGSTSGIGGSFVEFLGRKIAACSKAKGSRS